jgi:hypothetical protein
MSRSGPRLVFETAAVAAVVPIEEGIQRTKGRRSLRAEAEAIKAWYGHNAYTDFLTKHHRRPDPKEATAIGRLIGARVKATDGRMYPAQSAAERKAGRAARKEAVNEADGALEVHRLRKAISSLAANTRDPADVLKCVCPDLDEPEIREQLHGAVVWLMRFAEEWHRREKGRTD